jgi:hypothetical protein
MPSAALLLMPGVAEDGQKVFPLSRAYGHVGRAAKSASAGVRHVD